MAYSSRDFKEFQSVTVTRASEPEALIVIVTRGETIISHMDFPAVSYLRKSGGKKEVRCTGA